MTIAPSRRVDRCASHTAAPSSVPNARLRTAAWQLVREPRSANPQQLPRLRAPIDHEARLCIRTSRPIRWSRVGERFAKSRRDTFDFNAARLRPTRQPWQRRPPRQRRRWPNHRGHLPARQSPSLFALWTATKWNPAHFTGPQKSSARTSRNHCRNKHLKDDSTPCDREPPGPRNRCFEKCQQNCLLKHEILLGATSVSA